MLSAGPAPPPPPWRWRYHGCIPLNDWYHLLRKAMEGQFAKKMRDRSNDAFVMRCLNNLRSMPTVAAFECLAKITLAVWTEMDEGGFADYFRRIYLTDPWKNWFLGAMPLGCTSGQQSIEAGHRGDKKILGHAALKAAPEVFLAESVPKILARAGITLDEHPPELMTRCRRRWRTPGRAAGARQCGPGGTAAAVAARGRWSQPRRGTAGGAEETPCLARACRVAPGRGERKRSLN
jgi:hypothetical protein